MLLVSPDFLSSDYIMNMELPLLEEAARAGALTLSWIAVRHSAYDATPLGEIQALNDFGQSPWLDFIARDLIRSGELGQMQKRYGIRGVTSNPAIFEKATGCHSRKPWGKKGRVPKT